MKIGAPEKTFTTSDDDAAMMMAKLGFIAGKNVQRTPHSRCPSGENAREHLDVHVTILATPCIIRRQHRVYQARELVGLALCRTQFLNESVCVFFGAQAFDANVRRVFLHTCTQTYEIT